MDRVYVTGTKGMLGRALVPLLRKRYKVFPEDLEERDIRDPALMDSEICGCEPRFVIHLAAMTDVDGCELDPDEAYRTNALGTRNVALACRRCDAVMAYINTGSVYNGTKRSPYTEYDEPDPISVYGRSKLFGEIEIRSLLSRFYIFYTCWMFGGGSVDSKFVSKIIKLAGEKDNLRIVNDKFGSPTYTVDLAGRIDSFIESGLFGKYHCVNSGCASRFDVAREILECAGIEDCELIPVPSSEFSYPAPRGAMEAMRNYNFELIGYEPMRSWQEALEEYIKSSWL